MSRKKFIAFWFIWVCQHDTHILFIDSKTSWLQKQVMPTLAGMVQTKDGFARVMEMLAAAHETISAPMWAMVNEYNNQVKDDDSVRNVVSLRYSEYVLDLLHRSFVETAAA